MITAFASSRGSMGTADKTKIHKETTQSQVSCIYKASTSDCIVSTKNEVVVRKDDANANRKPYLNLITAFAPSRGSMGKMTALDFTG